MPEISKTCYDKILPRDLRRFSSPEFGDDYGAMEMAVFKAKKWPNGSTLQVRFMGGTPEQQATVENFAKQWENHANLKLDFNNAANAEIRITFLDDGAWSYVGTDCLDIPLHAATMNYGWLDEGVVLHEFGHALGLIHEHQNPVGGIKWDRDNVIKDLSGPPNFWDEATIEHNIFRKYNNEQMNATAVDPQSIMMYPIPQHWTQDGFHTDANDVLSNIDEMFIGAEQNYPFDEADGAVELAVMERTAVKADIGQPGEQDLFKFSAATAGRYVIETAGTTDLVMSLYGPDNQTKLIAEDDDSGTGRNARINAHLATPGTYFVQVRHYNSARGTGTYRIQVSK